MKNNQLLVLLTALITLSACSSAPKTQTASVDDIKVEEYLTERAIAQAQVGGELLVKLIGNAATSEKQALVKLIENTAREQGISIQKGLQLSSKNVGQAFTEAEAASIVKGMAAKSSLSVFKSASFQNISKEADAVLAKATAAQNASGSQLSSNINLADPALRADVKNIHNGFGKNPEYTKVYIAVRKNTGLPIWTQNTCTTFGKLDKVAGQNLLTLGQNQVPVARWVATNTAGGEKATQCMIKKGSVQLANDVVNVLHVPEAQVANTIAVMIKPCNLFPEPYALAAEQAIQANGGHVPSVSQVQCN